MCPEIMKIFKFHARLSDDVPFGAFRIAVSPHDLFSVPFDPSCSLLRLSRPFEELSDSDCRHDSVLLCGKRVFCIYPSFFFKKKRSYVVARE